jgi:septal ring factor EnvC (AmiA/AmiB activator)
LSKVASAALLLIIAAAASTACAADKDPKGDLKELRGRIEALQKQLADAEGTRDEAADGLRASERAISEANRTLRDLAEQQRVVNARLGDLQEQSQRASGDIADQQTQLARVLYQQYTGLQPDAVKLLLNGEDPNRVARELNYLGYLARARADLLRNLRSNLVHVNDLARTTQQQSAELAAIQAEQQTQRKKLEAEQRQRKLVLARTSKEIEKQRRAISTLKRNEERLSKLVEQLGRIIRSKPAPLRNDRLPDATGDGRLFTQLKGSLSLPVRGELRNRFGSPREDSGLSWKGLFIAAASGQDVKAIAAGRVVFADWLRGFGNLLIIDHGGDYMSLYGNNEALYKQVGDTIRGGEAIAQVGDSGGNSNSGLYFEMRYQGKAFDPLKWVNLKQ